jgi:hypothetical protein
MIARLLRDYCVICVIFMEETFHRRKRSVWLSWRMDETQRSMDRSAFAPKTYGTRGRRYNVGSS